MRKWRSVALLGMVALFVTAAAYAGGGQADLRSDLALVRQATAKYHDVARAEADGYVEVSECVAIPGLATMGIHYANFALMATAAVEVDKPEMLLYVPSPNGGLRLVGVEYYGFDSDQNLATSNDRPFLFGRGFDGPMEGHGPGQPIHYDLHVWTWQASPGDMFAEFNTHLHC